MSLNPGSRIGPYEVATLLGVGGMGEVYQATDTKLKRQVAVKVLPAALATDRDRLARFQREAQVLAQLNHPNIAAIYGLEDTPSATALVMELVDGPTLADRIRQAGRGLPLDECLALARQIAEALEAAHAQGIVHRDLKPANIKVRPDGTVKVLDFGLAKAMDPAGGGVDPHDSPTVTTPALMTAAGVILGTAAYMSPEQARGGTIDQRADLWAFGCVLFEMLTGTRAFPGDTVSDVVAAVLRGEPDWAALPALPPSATRLLRRCLEKAVRRRMADASSATRDIEDALQELSQPVAVSPATAAAPQRQRAEGHRRRLWLGLAVLAGSVAAVTAASTAALMGRQAPQRVSRLMLLAPAGSTISPNRADRNIAITPDGSRVIYVGENASGVFVRALDSLAATRIASVSGARGPFVSPDGQWVGFIDNQTMKKVPIAGGPVVPVARVDAVGPRGAAWLNDGTIVFATTSRSGLLRVSENGGEPQVITQPDAKAGEVDHLWPEPIPGRRAIIFTATLTSGNQVRVLDLESGQSRVIVQGATAAVYVAPGYLVYRANRAELRAVRFDARRLEVVGDSIELSEQALSTAGGFVAQFAAGADGTLAYMSADAVIEGRAGLVWVDRRGRELDAPAPMGTAPRISPEGRQVVIQNAGEAFLWDAQRGTTSRLTSSGAQSVTWTPDSKYVIFGSTRDAENLNLWRQATDGSPAERLTASPHLQVPTDVTPDGRALIFMEVFPETGFDVMSMSLDGRATSTPLVRSPFVERNGTVSPNGRWLTYESDATGRFEVYAKLLEPSSGQAVPVSTTGVFLPRWNPDGTELFYFDYDRRLMRVSVDPGRTGWTAARPAEQLDGRFGAVPAGVPVGTYDIERGQGRLLMTREAATPVDPYIVVVQNWVQEVRRLLP